MPNKTPKDMLDWLDREAEEFSGTLSREYYLNRTGLKDDLVLAPAYERHAELFQRDTVDQVLRAETGDPRYPNLREFVVDGYLDQAAKEISEELAARETADVVEWEGEQLPYRAVQQRVMNDPDPSRRRDLDLRRLDVTAAQNELRQRRWDLLYRQTRDLGFANYAALCDQLGELGLERLRETMERFLWDTEKSYRERLEQELRAIDVDPALAERSDLLYLFRAPQFDNAFPSARMLPVLDATLRDLGVDVEHQANVHIDAEERPKKTPRAFCAAVEIPGEIYLVISPHGGHDDFRALFHEGGHAQHFAHVAGDQPFAFRGLGDNSVTEGFAFVLEHLLYSPAWLRRYLEIEDSAAYLSMAIFHKLYFLRRYAAKLLYELDLHTGDDVRAYGKRYADLLTAHVGVRHSPEDYLSDLDSGFYAARYLRAWTFDAQLRAYFVHQWGDEWFRTKEGGEKLRELWSFGQRYNAPDLLRRLGEPDLDIAALAAEVLF